MNERMKYKYIYSSTNLYTVIFDLSQTLHMDNNLWFSTKYFPSMISIRIVHFYFLP